MARTIYITQSDKTKLQELVDEIVHFNLNGRTYVKDLDTELNRAAVVSDDGLPADVITMHSKVSLTIGGSDDETVTLVYPDEIDVAQNKISVLSPIGTAILGYREGDTVEWTVPDGTVMVYIKKVLYQPEAALEA